MTADQPRGDGARGDGASDDEPIAPDDGAPTPPEDVAIEDATAADVDRVVECWQALVEHGRRFGLHLRSDANELAARETLAAAVADDRVLVARREGRVVGFCSLALQSGGFERDRTRGVVENLFVEPAARGDGVGTALLAAGEARLAERGADVVAVEAMAADESVREFYRERGFAPHRVAYEKRLD